MTTFGHLVDENTPDNSSETFEAIGRVIALWADIDDLLFDVFKIVVGTREDVASVIYYRMNSLRDKIELTRKVAELTLFYQKCYEEIDETLKDIVKKSEFRNNIAHNPIMSMVRFNAKIANFEHSLVSSTSKNKNTKRVVQAEIEHIEEHITEMIPLYARLEKFPEFLTTYLRVMKEEVGSKPS